MAKDESWRNEELMAELHEQHNETEIAEEVGCSRATVSKWLKKHGLKPENPKEEKPWQDKETLEELNPLFSQIEMAEKLGCERNTIIKWMNRHGIENKTPEKDDPWRDKETLEELYEHHSQREIADILGCSRATVVRWLRKHEIEQRDKSEALKKVHSKKPAGHELDPDRYERWVINRRDYGVKVGVHQLLAIADGADPYKVFHDDYHIHHKNGCSIDNRHDNVELMKAEEHTRYHANEQWRNGSFDGRFD